MDVSVDRAESVGESTDTPVSANTRARKKRGISSVTAMWEKRIKENDEKQVRQLHSMLYLVLSTSAYRPLPAGCESFFNQICGHDASAQGRP